MDLPFGLQNLLTDQQAWDVAVFINSNERPQDPRFTGDVEETQAMFHTSKHNLYGTEVNGAKPSICEFFMSASSANPVVLVTSLH